MEVCEPILQFKENVSLVHWSAVSSVLAVWMQKDIQQEVQNVCKRQLFQHQILAEWENIEYLVFEKIEKLSTPKSIFKILRDIVHPIGMQLFDWIIYQESMLNKESKTNPFLLLYIECVCWTPEGRVNYKKTAKNLLTKNELADSVKYEIACFYCLEQELLTWSKRLPISENNLSDDNLCSYILYWTYFITGTEEYMQRFMEKNYRGSKTMDESLLLIAVLTSNEPSVKYLWGKLSVEKRDIANAIILAAEKYYINTDILYYFLSQSNYEQLERAFKVASRSIFHALLSDEWKDRFLATWHHVSGLISIRDFIYIFEIVSEYLMDKRVKYTHNDYIYIMRDIWETSPKYLRDGFVKDIIANRSCLSVLKRLLTENTSDIAIAILSHASAKEKGIILLLKGVDICTHLLAGGEWKMCEIFLNSTFISMEDIFRFKKKFVERFGSGICLRFLRRYEFQEIDAFHNWSCMSENKKCQFKEQLVHRNKFFFVSSLIEEFPRNSSLLEKLESLLDWALVHDEDKNMFKSCMFRNYFFKDQMWRTLWYLLGDCDFIRADILLNWCFLNDTHVISAFKANILKMENGYLSVVFSLVSYNDHLLSLKRLVEWCGMSDEEIRDFKENMINCEETKRVFSSLLYISQFELAEELLDWCCNSFQKEAFKRVFILNFLYCNLELFVSKNTEYVGKLLYWLKPSMETIRDFKAKYDSESNPGELKVFFVDMLNQFLKENDIR